jgi:general secretion pathway protein H
MIGPMGSRLSPGRPGSGKRPVGFTLIEVLLVVAITGIILAVAVVNLLPSGAQLARRDASALALAIEHSRDAAWFGGLPTAISVVQGQVRKWRLAGNEWQPAAMEQRIEGELAIVAMHVDGQAIPPGERMVFMPDGLGSSFRVAIDVRGHPWAIEGDASGSVRLVER